MWPHLLPWNPIKDSIKYQNKHTAVGNMTMEFSSAALCGLLWGWDSRGHQQIVVDIVYTHVTPIFTGLCDAQRFYHAGNGQFVQSTVSQIVRLRVQELCNNDAVTPLMMHISALP